MPFSTPSFSDFVRISENGLSSSFYGEETVLRKSVLKVLSRVFAGVAYLVVLILSKMWKNLFIYSCDAETLEDKGVDFDFPHKPEGYARGQVIVKKTTASNVSLAQGIVLTDESGLEYEIDSDYTVTGSVDADFPIRVIAVQSGSESDVDASAVLSFRDGTPEGLADDVVVDEEGISGGVKREVSVNGNIEYWGETIEEYRQRLLDYRRNPPSGGCGADYRSWAERFAFVSRCIVQQNYPNVNSVTCVLVHYDDEGGIEAVNNTNRQEAEAYMQSDVRAPITADIRVVSCLPKTIDLGIKVSPNDSRTRESVLSAVKKIFQSYAPGDLVRATDLDVKLLGSSSAESVSVFRVGSGSSESLSKSDHELPVVGDVSWVNADG